jgi:two-component system cell cycle sensor histidine kinase PleC
MPSSRSSTSDKNIVDRTKRRSAASQVIRDVRKNVANNIDKPLEYEHERMRTYAQNHINAKIALPLFIIIVAVVSGNWISSLIPLYWSVIALLSYGLMFALSYRFMRPSDELPDLKKWRRHFLYAQMVVAFTWSLFAYFYCTSCNIENTFVIIQFSTILVLQAITMMLSYGFGASVLVTSAPPTIILATRLILSWEPASMVMGGILISSQVFFYFVADRFRLSVLSDLASRAEREELIAELETARAISEEARRRAEEANLAKSRFLATMSHELRTPLNAILGFSEVMQTEVLGPIGNETYKGYIDDINDSGAHLLNVINEILDLSRIEAGRHDMQEEAIRLVHIIEEANHMVALKANKKGVTLTLDLEENMPLIWADEKAVRQIALNLLSNALKFTPTGGQITIRAGWTSSGGQYFSIRDTGPGIAEEEIPIVLSSFGQGSIAIKSAEQGSGLGLPIVQALMHMHDGRFELKSKLREGTEVIATFPRSRVLEIMEKTEHTGNGPRTRKPMRNLRQPVSRAG